MAILKFSVACGPSPDAKVADQRETCRDEGSVPASAESRVVEHPRSRPPIAEIAREYELLDLALAIIAREKPRFQVRCVQARDVDGAAADLKVKPAKTGIQGELCHRRSDVSAAAAVRSTVTVIARAP
eukprot:CAMPEP_0176125522 /NCGR_PEP_ID=MMETSP0120_2-20121206/63321_1 /TAXON_ID=160619 /ORGANISM="Kryptoperidinium foliaceum, Strain CCMP 1326" /LENGTH=127 /DNA_ID=CAMNT_0017460375 /DNA_START=169 /DNA_END=550 /DNA_ORIENTATION=+